MQGINDMVDSILVGIETEFRDIHGNYLGISTTDSEITINVDEKSQHEFAIAEFDTGMMRMIATVLLRVVDAMELEK